jgi:hypothetical protein
MSADDALPGLDVPAPPAGQLEEAVLATLEAMRAQGLVKPTDAARVALAVDLCRVLEHKRVSGRVSTYSNDARVLMELLAGFAEDATEADAALVAAMEQWSEFVAGVQAHQ